MFWESEAAKAENSLHLLLKEDDLKLPQVLNDPFLLQELRSNNQQLIDLWAIHFLHFIEHFEN